MRHKCSGSAPHPFPGRLNRPRPERLIPPRVYEGVSNPKSSTPLPGRQARTLQYRRLRGPHGKAVSCVAPEHPIDLMLEFLKHIDGPVVALYLLLEQRDGGPPAGRYQSPAPISRRKLRGFCERFGEFLEQDGRHAFWIMDLCSSQKLIFDRHDLVFAYGNLDAFERVLVGRGYIPGRIRGLPRAHRQVDPRFDEEAHRLHEWLPWMAVPLYRGDRL